MPQITDIKPQKRQGRFNIYLDGKYSFAISAESLVKAGLSINQEISSDSIEKLIKEDEFGKIFESALKFISFRPRSEKELQDWFKRKEVGGETQKMVVKKLKHLGFLNDEEFAKWWIEQRTEFHPSGGRLIKMELKQKGISEDIIARLLDCYIAKGTEIDLAKKVLEKKLPRLKNYKGLELRKKLQNILAQRGFSWETIKELVDTIVKKTDNEIDGE
jgi:regulatory protein